MKNKKEGDTEGKSKMTISKNKTNGKYRKTFDKGGKKVKMADRSKGDKIKQKTQKGGI